MYKLLTLAALLLAFSFSACQNKQQSTSEEGEKKSCCASAAAQTEVKTFTPEALLTNGASLVDLEVELQGTIAHVCSHGGRKCFLAGDKPGMRIQVMAGGDIKAFDKKQIGQEIRVKGIVKEHRIQKEAIENQEKSVTEEMSQEGCTEMERCKSVMSNVKQMKQWMADNEKDYYPVYYVDGQHYDVVR